MGVSAHTCVTMQVYVDSSVCKCVPTSAYVSVCSHLWPLGVQAYTGFFGAWAWLWPNIGIEFAYLSLPSHCVVHMVTSVA